MKVIKAILQNPEERNKCFGCLFRGPVTCYDLSLSVAMLYAGLPDCNDGYIYVSCEVNNENTK